MIETFRCKDTETLFGHVNVKRFNSFARVALRKLYQLDAAKRLEDLCVPPGNRLEALSGNRKGQYSIRINDQWRICFEWRNESAFCVEIVDYRH